MADNSGITNLPSIQRLCHDWRVTKARLRLEALEAGDDEDAVAGCLRAR